MDSVLQLTPKQRGEYRIAALQSDYANMREMFFGEPPKFDGILALLKEWEREFNGK
jgi:hypothetical protein